MHFRGANLVLPCGLRLWSWGGAGHPGEENSERVLCGVLLSNRSGTLLQLDRAAEAVTPHHQPAARCVALGRLPILNHGRRALVIFARTQEADARRCNCVRPAWGKAQYRLGAALLAQHRFREAVEAADRAERLSPDVLHTQLKMECLSLLRSAVSKHARLRAAEAGGGGRAVARKKTVAEIEQEIDSHLGW